MSDKDWWRGPIGASVAFLVLIGLTVAFAVLWQINFILILVAAVIVGGFLVLLVASFYGLWAALFDKEGK